MESHRERHEPLKIKYISRTLTWITLHDNVKSVKPQHEPISGAIQLMLLVEASKCTSFFRFPINCKGSEAVYEMFTVILTITVFSEPVGTPTS
jgi:hypothetical protein